MTENEKTEYLQIIENSLDSVRPFLIKDGGNVELIDLSDEMVVSIRLTGSCKTCSMSSMTMKNGIEESIRKNLPQIEGVEEITA